MKNKLKNELMKDCSYAIISMAFTIILFYYNKILSALFLAIFVTLIIITLINYKSNKNDDEETVNNNEVKEKSEESVNKQQTITKIQEKQQYIMLLEVDNKDEVTRTMEDDKKPLITAQVERIIQAYAANMNAMVKKYSSTKYILLVQEEYLKNEIEKKFDILNIIKEINEGNTIAVTLSIGVGMGGNTPSECYDMAKSAKDLALGRGGDQVVVKDGKNILFFGGKTKEVERTTRVRARVISQALLGLVKDSSNIFIMGHNNPDIDCFGAAIGLFRVTKSLDKKAYIINDNLKSKPNYFLEKLKNDEEYSGTFIDSRMVNALIDEKSLLIIVDTDSVNYVIDKELLTDIKRKVIIDHHRKSRDYITGALLTYIEPYSSSVCEMITEIIQYILERPKLKPIEAEALMAGIILDTKSFYFKTGVRTFEAAAFLKKWGADTIQIKKIFSSNLDSYLKKASILKSAVVENGIAVAVCPNEIEDTILVAQAADELLNISGITASFVIDRVKNDIIISGRSLGDINVQVILETLGGGGHMTMAGARLHDTSSDKARELLKEALDKYLMEGER